MTKEVVPDADSCCLWESACFRIIQPSPPSCSSRSYSFTWFSVTEIAHLGDFTDPEHAKFGGVALIIEEEVPHNRAVRVRRFRFR